MVPDPRQALLIGKPNHRRIMIKETVSGNKASRPKQTSLLQRDWIRGESVTRGSITVTPVSRRISLGLPGWIRQEKGLVFFFQRPAALILKRGDSTETIPIHDVQQIIFFIMIAVTTLWLYIIIRPKRSKRAK
jgi:hypothetical protein